MQYILYILTLPFLYLNYKIVVSDLKFKKIPNKYLGYLLLLIPFYYIYIFFSFPEVNYLLFVGQIFLTFLISFVLYYFGIWAAGDAKYLLVLALFIPYMGIIPFIGNIALITLIYLLGYFIYFYLGKVLFNKNYRQSLWINIKQDLSEKWKVHKGNKGGNTYKIILKWLVIFLLIFVSIRLIRIYSLNSILYSNTGKVQILQNIIDKYNIYIIILFILIFIGGLYLFKIGINKLKEFLAKKLKININLIGNILLIFLSIFLISFIIYEYLQNPNEIKNYLFKIFTIYLTIYLITKILVFSYKITFGIAEYKYINIKDLKEGVVVDKEYLIKMFGNQIGLGHIPDKNRKYTKKILSPSPTNYFQNIKNPINKNTLKIIKKSFTITNSWHINNKTTNFTKNITIKILNTFSFASYILLGFLITFFLQDKIFKNIFNFLIKIIKNIFNYS